jgi:hypothetical protein
MISPIANDQRMADYMELARALRRCIDHEGLPVRKFEMQKLLGITEDRIRAIASIARIETKA